MKSKLLLLSLIIAGFTSCEKPGTPIEKISSESFLPLQIGNYWRINDQNYTEIQDTVRIKGQLYYKLFSLIGGDAISEDFLRIDENQNLISASIRNPDYSYLKAKFNANIGDSFQTLGDQSYNDYKVTVIKKNENEITFSYDMIYHPNLKGHPHTVTFVKGMGWKSSWKTIRINNIIYNK